MKVDACLRYFTSASTESTNEDLMVRFERYSSPPPGLFLSRQTINGLKTACRIGGCLECLWLGGNAKKNRSFCPTKKDFEFCTQVTSTLSNENIGVRIKYEFAYRLSITNKIRTLCNANRDQAIFGQNFDGCCLRAPGQVVSVPESDHRT